MWYMAKYYRHVLFGQIEMKVGKVLVGLARNDAWLLTALCQSITHKYN